MKGFFGASAYYAMVILSIASLSGQFMTLEKALPNVCEDLPLEGKYVWLPDSVAQTFDEATINLHFSTIKGNIDVWGKVQNRRIASLKCGRSNNYDYEVWMSDLDAIEVATSDKPITKFQELRRERKIKVEANGEENRKRLEDAETLEGEDNEPVPQSIRDFFEKFSTINLIAFWPF